MKFSPFERETGIRVYFDVFEDAHDKIYSYKIYVEYFQYIFKLVQFITIYFQTRLPYCPHDGGMKVLMIRLRYNEFETGGKML